MREMLRCSVVSLFLLAAGGVPAIAQVTGCNGNFVWQPGLALPTTVCTITNSSSSSLSVAAVVDANSTRWLAVTPASATIAARGNQAFRVSLSPENLASGTYSGSYRLVFTTATSRTETTYTINLTVSGTATPPTDPDATLTCTPSFRTDLGSTAALPGTCTLSPRSSAYTYTIAATETWLKLAAANGSVAANANGRADFSVNAAGLAPGTYVGYIEVRSATAPALLSAMVVLTVSTTPPRPAIGVNMTDVAFRSSIGAAGPAAQEISVTGSQALMPLAVAVKTSRGGDWLFPTLSAPSSPARMAVNVSGDQLAPGRYDGTITITSPGSTATPVEVRVTLVVDSTISLLYHQEAPAPAPKCFAVPADIAPQQLAVSISQGDWLTVEPAAGATPNVFCVSARAESLAPGEYTGRFVLTPGDLRLDVKLNVTPPARLSAAPGALRFLVEPGRVPAAQAVKVLVDNNPEGLPVTVSVNAEAKDWLTVTPGTGTAPLDAQVTVDPTKLVPGSYSAVIRIAATREGGPATEVAVSVEVPAVTLRVPAPVISLTYEVGSNTPTSRVITVTATDTAGRSYAVPYRVTTGDAAGTGAGPDWLLVTAGTLTAPNPFQVSLNTARLARGTYTASVTVEAPGTTNGRVTVPVRLAVINPRLFSEPSGYALNFYQGARLTETRQFAVRSADARTPMAFTAEVRLESGRGWLTLQGPVTRSTPATLTAEINTSTLTAGAYRGTVVLTAPDSSNRTVLVPFTVVVRKPAPLQTLPASLEFSFQQELSQAQTKEIRMAGDATEFRTSVSGGANWVTATADASTTPATVEVTVDPTGMEPGTYAAAVRMEPVNGATEPRIVPVKMTITARPQAIVSTTPIELELPQGSTTPAERTVEAHTNGEVIRLAVTALPHAGNWLKASGIYAVGELDNPSGTFIDRAVQIPFQVSTAGLAVGRYTANLELVMDDQSYRAVVPVNLTVRPNATLPLVTDGAGTKTSITLVSLDRAAASYTVKFYGQDGRPMVLPLVRGGRVAEISGTIPAGGSRTIETTGTDPTVLLGWAEIISTERLAGFGTTVTVTEDGAPVMTAVPIQLPRGRSALTPFDNTSGRAAMVTLVNPATSAATISMVARWADGTEAGNDSVTLGARASTTVTLATRFPATAGSNGTLELTSSAGDLAVYSAARLNERNAVWASPTSPVAGGTEARSRVMPHIVDGGGQRSAIVLMNAGRVSAPFSLQFRTDDGSNVTFPIAGVGAVAEYADTIAPGSVRIVETTGEAAATQAGTAELIAPASITGSVLYPTAATFGAADVDRTVESGLVLPFDATQGAELYLAIASPDWNERGNPFLVARSEDGQTLGTGEVTLFLFGRQFVKVTELIPRAAGNKGVIEVVAPVASVVAVQAMPDGTATFVAPVH